MSKDILTSNKLIMLYTRSTRPRAAPTGDLKALQWNTSFPVQRLDEELSGPDGYRTSRVDAFNRAFQSSVDPPRKANYYTRWSAKWAAMDKNDISITDIVQFIRDNGAEPRHKKIVRDAFLPLFISPELKIVCRYLRFIFDDEDIVDKREWNKTSRASKLAEDDEKRTWQDFYPKALEVVYEDIEPREYLKLQEDEYFYNPALTKREIQGFEAAVDYARDPEENAPPPMLEDDRDVSRDMIRDKKIDAAILLKRQGRRKKVIGTRKLAGEFPEAPGWIAEEDEKNENAAIKRLEDEIIQRDFDKRIAMQEEIRRRQAITGVIPIEGSMVKKTISVLNDFVELDPFNAQPTELYRRARNPKAPRAPSRSPPPSPPRSRSASPERLPIKASKKNYQKRPAQRRRKRVVIIE